MGAIATALHARHRVTVAAGEACKKDEKDEVRVSWNRKGQKGAPGTPGVNGKSVTLTGFFAGVGGACSNGGVTLLDEATSPTYYLCDGAKVDTGTTAGPCWGTGRDVACGNGTVTDQETGLPRVGRLPDHARAPACRRAGGGACKAERGVAAQHGWTIGLAGEATISYDAIDLTLPSAIVLGAEGSGLRRLVRERCDRPVTIPMHGQLDRLNVSVAAGIVLIEAVRRRGNGRQE